MLILTRETRVFAPFKLNKDVPEASVFVTRDPSTNLLPRGFACAKHNMKTTNINVLQVWTAIHRLHVQANEQFKQMNPNEHPRHQQSSTAIRREREIVG